MKTLLTVQTALLCASLVGCSDSSIDRRSADRKDDNNRVVQRPTEFDQSSKEADVDTVREIRRALTSDDSLSISAQNVKIIATNRVIHLQGEVTSAAEKDRVVEAARRLGSEYKLVENLRLADAPIR